MSPNLKLDKSKPVASNFVKFVNYFFKIFSLRIVNVNDQRALAFESEEFSFQTDQMQAIDWFWENYQTIKQIVDGHLQERWEWMRLASLNRAIIASCITMFNCFPNFAKEIIIDVGVEYAKVYGSETDQQFINGLLDKIKDDRV